MCTPLWVKDERCQFNAHRRHNMSSHSSSISQCPTDDSDPGSSNWVVRLWRKSRSFECSNACWRTSAHAWWQILLRRRVVQPELQGNPRAAQNERTHSMATCSFIMLYDDCRNSLKYAVNMSAMDPAATSSYLGSFIRSEYFLCSAFLFCNQCVHTGIILQRCCGGTRWSPPAMTKTCEWFGWWQMDANGHRGLFQEKIQLVFQCSCFSGAMSNFSQAKGPV